MSSGSSIVGIGNGGVDKVLDDYVGEWKSRRIDLGFAENRCFLFLGGASSLVECRVCSRYIYPEDGVSCTVRSCQKMYHAKCAKETLQFPVLKKFKCPQPACFVCKQKFFWRCVRCETASHDKCAAWPDEVIHLRDQPGWTICWRHPKGWRQEQHPALTTTFEGHPEQLLYNIDMRERPPGSFKSTWDVFTCLPLPYVEEEFKVESTVEDCPNDRVEPPSYIHISRQSILGQLYFSPLCLAVVTKGRYIL